MILYWRSACLEVHTCEKMGFRHFELNFYKISKFLKGYAIDTICRCAFSVETNAYEDSEHQLIKQGRAIIQGFQVTNWMDTIGFLVFYLFPGLEAVS